MKKLITTSILFGLFLGLVTPAFSATGTSGGQFLKICVDGESAALGGASAVSEGVGSIFLNPAGLGTIDGKEVKFSQVNWIESISYSNVSYAQKAGSGVIGVGMNYLTVPAITKYDNLGNKLDDSYAPVDMAVNVAYARNVVDGVDIGANLKYISSKLDDQTASAYAVDLGLKKQVDKKLELGVVVQNLGTEIKYFKDGDPLPLNLKVGGKYSISNISLLLDLNQMNDVGFFANAGAEYEKTMGDVDAAVRLGYNSDVKGLDSISGFSAGLGITYKKYTLDYAIAPYGELGLTHRISLSYKF